MSGDTRRVTGPLGAHRSATDRPVGALRPRRALPPGSVGAALPEGLLENKSWSLWDEGRDLCSFFSGVTSAKGSEIPSARRPRWRIRGCGIPGKSRGWGRGKEGSGCFRGSRLFLQHSLALQLIKFMGNPYFLRQPHLAGASLQLWEEQAKIKWIRSTCPCNKPGQKGLNSQKIPNQSSITPSLGYSSGILDSPWHIPCPQPRQLQFPPVNFVQNIHLREQHNYLWERSVDGWKF